MKYVQLLAFLCVCTLCDADQSVSKEGLARELIQIYGIDEMVVSAKRSAEGQAKEAADRMFIQFKSSMPELGERFWTRITAAADKMIATVQNSWTPEEALAVWRTEYCADLTIDELKQIIEAAKTPLGKKQIAAGKRANSAFQQFYAKRAKEVVEDAMKNYVLELQQIAAQAASEAK